MPPIAIWQIVHRSSPTRRVSRTIDEFEATGSVERMYSLAGPLFSRGQAGQKRLFETIMIKPCHLRDAKGDAISFAAILHRPQESTVTPDHTAGRTRRCDVDQDGVAAMRRPWAAKIIRRPYVKCVRIGSTAVANGRKHPPLSDMLDQRHVAGRDTGQQRRFIDPATGKRRRPVKLDCFGRPVSGIIQTSPFRSKTKG